VDEADLAQGIEKTEAYLEKQDRETKVAVIGRKKEAI